MTKLFVLIGGSWERAWDMGQRQFTLMDGRDWLDLDDYDHYYEEY